MAKAKTNERDEKVWCPAGRFFLDLEKGLGSKSKFWEHLSRSRLEFFRAMKILVDARIEDLEKKGAGKERKKATKIKVE